MTITLSNAIKILKEMRSLPEVQLAIYGEEKAEKIYKYFTMPHPRYKVFQNKKWGVALMPVPDNVGEYLKGKSRQVVRTNRTKCIKKGYSFRLFNPQERISEIMKIHRSMPYRQGSPMNDAYLNEDDVLKWASDKPLVYGIFNQSDKLMAYAYVPEIGDLCIISRILGHNDALNDGLMYFLISEVVDQMVIRKLSDGYPKWIMYDTFFGAQEGLRYFKERLGFSPYKVIWKLG
jgi:hypothetical protein